MRNSPTTVVEQSRNAAIHSALGQIDLIDGSGEIVRSWRLRTPKCTLGSSPDCSVQIEAPNIAPLHATLIFGKKHTLLRALAPTRIQNRNVKEWLIDHPTEIQIGQCRLVVYPTIGVMATVVQAERLIDQASKLCKEPTPIVCEKNSNAQTVIPEEKKEPSPAVYDVSSNLAAIEKLLLSLQESIERFQESLIVESKQSSEAITKTVSTEFDSFGKTWFSTLNDQLSNQKELQQTLLANLTEQLSERFGAIDGHLNRVSEATTQHTNSLNDLLEQAKTDQSIIETRFQEVIRHRDAPPPSSR